MTKLKMIQLFSGIGAQAQGLKEAGIEHEAICCEIDAKAHASYEAIHGPTPNLGDITKVEHLPECDLLFYSWPCQSCSIQGRQEGMVEGSGTESALLWEVIRLLRDAEKRGVLPEYLGAENVPAVTNKRNKAELDRMIGILEDMGYTVSWSIMNAKDYGVPQNRKRFFMVASRSHGRFVFPAPCPDGRVLKDVLEPPEDVPAKCWLSPERIAKYEEHYDRCQAKGISPTVTTPAGGGHMPRIRWPNGDSVGYREAGDGDGLVMARPTLARGTVQKQMSPTVTCGQTSGVCIDIFESVLEGMTPVQQLYNCVIIYVVTGEAYANAPETYAREILSCMRSKNGTQNVCKRSGRTGLIQKEKVLFKGVHETGILEDWNPGEAQNYFECTQYSENLEPDCDETDLLLQMWEHIEPRCSSHRWKSAEQCRRELASLMSELSSKRAQSQKSLQDLWETCNGPRILRNALCTLQEIWGSLDDKDAEVLYRLWRACKCEGTLREALSSRKKGREATPFRIRYLTTKEVWRLQGFSDEAYYRAKAVPTSDTQLYRQAGNSIAVPCLTAIFRGMFLDGSWEQMRRLEDY